MAINEIQRQTYLNAMGVQSYFPRFVLPGALASHPCQWPSEAQITETTSDRIGAVSAPDLAGQARETTAILRQSLKEDHSAKPDQVASAENTSVSKEKEGRYKINFVTLSQNLAVVNHLPHTSPGHLDTRHMRLLLNIGKALGLDQLQSELNQIPFAWPISQGALVDNSVSAGREALQGFLEHNMQVCGAQVLLVMGDGLEEYLFDGPSSSIGAIDSGAGWHMVVSKSLDQMLRLPGAIKPDVWRDLKKVAELL